MLTSRGVCGHITQDEEGWGRGGGVKTHGYPNIAPFGTGFGILDHRKFDSLTLACNSPGSQSFLCIFIHSIATH